MILPNTIIAGAPKSGSSSIYWWLSSHPDVCASKTKETHYFDDKVYPRFNAAANVIEHGLSNYGRYFDHCPADAKVIMEATPIYLYQENALKHLADFDPKPKVVLILREPSQRAHSQFRFNKYRLGNIVLDKDYSSYLKETEGTDGDPLMRGEYIRYVQRWVEGFGKERVYVMQLEQLFNDKAGQMKQLARFLALDEGFYDSFDFMKRNETRKMRSTKLHRLGLQLQPLVPQWLQESAIIPLYLKFNSTAMPKVSEHDKQMIEDLKPRFTAFNEELAREFTNIDLSLWK
ncbi:MAG: sulfotransferase domain-containing protein [Flavobacteriales bacterium]|nr:sulfotransferase domain-containing protein [Flavobacteriales bacterium]